MLLFLAYGKPIFALLLSGLSPLQRLARKFLRSADEGMIQIGSIGFGDKDRVRHTHIVGATGSGKTVLMESLIYEDLRRGRGALIIDPKGDRELYERIQNFCRRLGRGSDLHLLSAAHIEESARWNPCRLGTATEVQTKFLNSWVFSEPFYEKACQSTLLEVMNALVKEKETFTFPDVVRVLKRHATKNSPTEALFMDFKNLSESEWAEVLCAAPKKKTLEEIHFLDCIRKNEILFIDLPTEGKSVQSGQIGKLILQEIMLVSGLRKTFPHLRSKVPFSIYVDEFDAFATESFATFLNKARSSNFMIHFGHQTLSDLKTISDAFTGKLLGNTNIRFVFRQDDPTDAETWSAFFGTSSVVKSTYRTSGGIDTGDASNRESKEFRIHPDAIKELGIGECIASIKSAGLLEKIVVPLPTPEKLLPKLPVSRPPAIFSPPTPAKPDPGMTVQGVL